MENGAFLVLGLFFLAINLRINLITTIQTEYKKQYKLNSYLSRLTLIAVHFSTLLGNNIIVQFRSVNDIKVWAKSRSHGAM